jgi:hypothetical protein
MRQLVTVTGGRYHGSMIHAVYSWRRLWFGLNGLFNTQARDALWLLGAALWASSSCQFFFYLRFERNI